MKAGSPAKGVCENQNFSRWLVAVGIGAACGPIRCVGQGFNAAIVVTKQALRAPLVGLMSPAPFKIKVLRESQQESDFLNEFFGNLNFAVELGDHKFETR